MEQMAFYGAMEGLGSNLTPTITIVHFVTPFQSLIVWN